MTEEKGFIIKDHRISDDANRNNKESRESTKEKPDETAPKEKNRRDSPLPEINFATFIFSLHSSALLHLGLIDAPGTGKKEKNLPVAKQTIDIIGMLEEKTRGNLTDDEEKMLKNILHDLRMMYVHEKK